LLIFFVLSGKFSIHKFSWCIFFSEKFFRTLNENLESFFFNYCDNGRTSGKFTILNEKLSIFEICYKIYSPFFPSNKLQKFSFVTSE
jgi:hypothetical protein